MLKVMLRGRTWVRPHKKQRKRLFRSATSFDPSYHALINSGSLMWVWDAG